MDDFLNRQPAMFQDFNNNKAEIYDTITSKKQARLTFNSLALYGLGLLVLIIYSIVVLVVDRGNRFLGLVVSLQIIMVDIVYVMFHLSKPQISNTSEIIILGGSRLTFVGFGFEYWFLGTCTVFVVFSSIITYNVVYYYLGNINLDKDGKLLLQKTRSDKNEQHHIRFSEFLDPQWIKANINIDDKNDKNDKNGSNSNPKPQCLQCLQTSCQTPLTSLISLLVFQLICTVIVSSSNLNLTKIRIIDTYHQQYIFGIASICVVLIILTFLIFWKMYSANDMIIKNSRKIQIAWIIFQVLILASTLILFALSGSFLLLSFGIFLPLTFMLALLEFNHIRHNDWTFIFPADKRKPPGMPFFKAFFKRGLPISDYKVITFVVAQICCLYSMGAIIAAEFSPVVGWGVAGMLSVIRLTALPMIKYFWSLEFNKIDLISATIGFILYISSFIGIFIAQKNDTILNADWKRAGFGVIAISYPILLCVVAGFMEWREQNYVSLKIIFSRKILTSKKDIELRFIAAAFIVSIILVLLFIIVVTVFLDWKLGISILLSMFVAICFVLIVKKWKDDGFYLGKKGRISVALFLISVFGLGVYLALTNRTTFFIGFSISWLALSLLALLSTVVHFLKIREKHGLDSDSRSPPYIYFDQSVVPVFIYDDNTNNISQFNQPIGVAAISTLMLLSWSTTAAILDSQTLGMFVTGVIWCFAYTKTRSIQQEMIHAFTNIFWALQPRVLDDSRIEATKQQFLSVLDLLDPKFSFKLKKVISTSNEKNISYQQLLDTLYGKTINQINAKSLIFQGLCACECVDKITSKICKKKAQSAVAHAQKQTRPSKRVSMSEGEKLKLLDAFAQKISIESTLFEIESRFYAHFLFSITHKTSSDVQTDEDTFKEFLDWMQNTLKKDVSKYRNKSHKDVVYTIMGISSCDKKQNINNQTKTVTVENKNNDDDDQDAKKQEPDSIESLRTLKKQFIEFKLKKTQENEENRKKEDEEHNQRENELEIGQKGVDIKDVNIQTKKEFEIIISKCNQTNPYIDETFPANAQSIFIKGERNTAKYPHSAVQRLRFSENTQDNCDGWQRPTQLQTSNSGVFSNINSCDITQGQIGDCYLLSSLGILATKEQSGSNPGILKDIIIPNDKYPECGAFLVRFYKRGKELFVLVDDQLPILSNDENIAFGTIRDNSSWWLSIIEKAYAKLYKSYQAIEGGKIHHCLVDLTNGYSSEIRLDDIEAKRQPNTLWNKILAAYKSNYLLGAGSNPGLDTNSKKGIAFGHAYGIVQMYQDSKYQLIKLQNPWGEGEWEGDWSDNSSLWTKYYKNKLNYTNRDEGTFWMNFNDFCNYFRNVYICRLLKPQKTFENVWDNITATGPMKPEHCVQYTLSSKKAGISVFITLQQYETESKTGDDENDKSGSSLAYMTFFVLDNGDDPKSRITMIGRDMIIGGGGPNGGTFINDREITGEINLSKANYPYKLVPLTFKEGMKAQFSLQIFCNEPIDCKLMIDPNPTPINNSTRTNKNQSKSNARNSTHNEENDEEEEEVEVDVDKDVEADAENDAENVDDDIEYSL